MIYVKRPNATIPPAMPINGLHTFSRRETEAGVLHIDTCRATNIRSRKAHTTNMNFDVKIKSAQNLNSAGAIGNRREQLTSSFRSFVYTYHVAVCCLAYPVTFIGMLNNNIQVINRFPSNSDCCVNYLYGARSFRRSAQ